MNTNISDFQVKAQSIASTVSSLSPAEALAKSLTCDRPTIDSAIKAYMSLCAARSMTKAGHDNSNNNNMSNGSQCYFSKSSNPQMAALLCARSLLKAINSFIIPSNLGEKKGNEKTADDEEKKLELEVVRIVWNGLVKNGKKPSMILGRTSLSHVFPIIKEQCFNIFDDENDADMNEQSNDFYPKDVDLDEFKVFINEFGRLLCDAEKRKNSIISMDNNDDSKNLNTDDDSCLLWDLDGGKSELERRRKRRELKSSCVRKDEKEDNDRLTIEEIE